MCVRSMTELIGDIVMKMFFRLRYIFNETGSLFNYRHCEYCQMSIVSSLLGTFYYIPMKSISHGTYIDTYIYIYIYIYGQTDR